MPSLTSLTFYLYTIGLTGTFPTTGLGNFSLPSLTSFILRLDSSNIAGSIPSMIPANAPLMTTYTLILTSNPLNAPIATDLLPSILSRKSTASKSTAYSLQFASCGITGTLALPLPSTNSTFLPSIALYMAFNGLTSLTIATNTSKYLQYLDASYNRELSGEVTNLFSSFSSITTTINAAYTSLGGTMPLMANVSTSLLTSLKLDNTTIDFCAGASRTAWSTTKLTTCTLRLTNAYNCSSLYPSMCLVSAAPPRTLFLAPIGCSGSPPSADFKCVDGVWTSNSSITAPTIVIPAGVSEVIVQGNVTSGTIVLQGIGTSINAAGCFNNLTVVTIELSPEELQKLGSKSTQQLLASNATCTSFAGVTIVPKVTGSSCKQVKVEKVHEEGGSLNAIFAISSSRCNLWWIIVAATVGGVIVIGSIVAVIALYALRQGPFRHSFEK